MARLPRLALAGRVHYGIQRGQGARPVFVDAEDRAGFLRLLFEAAAAERVALHAYALLDTEVQWLATPAEAPALSRMVQAVGRRYVSAYNRRHGGKGSLWDGRFRCGVVDPGEAVLATLLLVDGQPGETAAATRTGAARDARLADPPEYWALGNTPFEREVAWRLRLSQGLPGVQALALRQAALGGWAVSLEAAPSARGGTDLARPMRPRAPGRPPRR